jgi:hypothetical protein
MQSRTIIRRAAVALAAVVVASVAVPGSAEAVIDTDSVRLTDDKVDFGGSLFAAGVPVGSGSVQWDIVSGFYTPRLLGTLHLNNASGKYARMHISYWDGAGDLIDIRHGGTVRAPDNDHHDWSVDLSPINLRQITEVHVCTEISDNGVTFSQPDCTNAIYLY